MTANRQTVVVGESLVDLLWRTGPGTVLPAAGGSPANVAVGLHRLGRPVTLVTSYGDDPPGRLVAEHLARTGLDVLRVPTASGRTTVALAYVDESSGSATYDFLTAWDPAAIPVHEDTLLLHTGSLAIAVDPGADQVLHACRQLHGRPGRAVAVDLNVRPAVRPDRAAYRFAVERIVRVADVVKASDEDLDWLWPGQSPAISARLLLDRGPRLVVLTRGAEGAAAFTPGTEISVPAPRVAVADTIGAGDAFQSALLAGLHDPRLDNATGVRVPLGADELGRLLQRCVLAGALTATRVGAQPPTLAELDAAAAL